MWSCLVSKAAIGIFVVAMLAGCGNDHCEIECNQAMPTLSVFAASSLQGAFHTIGGRFTQFIPEFNFAGTQTLTAQITEGATPDVFASADTAHMTTLEKAGLIGGTPQIFAHNRLEIAVQRGNPKGIHTLADLARAGLVVVLADPSVPAGKYAQQALDRAHVTVHPASLELQVTGVLTKVALGEADAGIVYVSDIASSGKVDGVTIPDDQNVVADYSIAVLKKAHNTSAAKKFIQVVLLPDGQDVLKSFGFQGV
jgi:molybdate transport system substrate-binding protein